MRDQNLERSILLTNMKTAKKSYLKSYAKVNMARWNGRRRAIKNKGN